MATTKVVKVAVVGSGLAGLTAAYLLTQQQQGDVHFDVHLFEKAPALGMDSSSISLPIPGKEKTWRVDVPMRSFQGGYYKQLMALYRKLGVAFVERDFTYSFSTLLPSGILTEMIYNGSSGLKGVSVPSKQRSMVWFVFWLLGLILCYIRLLLLSLPFMRPRGVERMSYASWVEQCSPKGVVARWTGFTRAWTGFTRVVLVPLFSAVCTAPEEEIWNHPVEELLDYIWLTLGTHHYVVQNGVRDVVARLAARVENIHLSSPIVALRPDENDPDLVSLHCEGKVHTGFQHVVFATQANRCVPLLTSYAEALPENKRIRRQAIQKQIDCLDNFGYSSTIVINHTDERLLPQDPRDHRDLNLIYIPSPSPRTSPSHPTTKGKSPKCLPPSYTMTTQVLPHPEGFPSHLPAVYQTTNPIVEPREGRILSVAALERAVLSLPAKEAVRGLYVRRGGEDRLGVLQGGGGKGSGPGIWICGSYAYSGIPLLEGCVVSARLVVQQGIWRREGVRNREEPW